MLSLCWAGLGWAGLGWARLAEEALVNNFHKLSPAVRRAGCLAGGPRGVSQRRRVSAWDCRRGDPGSIPRPFSYIFLFLSICYWGNDS
jgi:hypothetical protein